MKKRMLSVLLALALILSSVSGLGLATRVSAEDVDTSSMKLAFEWTAPTEDTVESSYNNSSSTLGSKNADFLAALNIEGAYLEVDGYNNCNEHGCMVNITFNPGDGEKTAGMGYPTGRFTRGTLVSSVIDAEITSVRIQLGFYKHEDGHDPYDADDWHVYLNALRVYVPADTVLPTYEKLVLIENSLSLTGKDFSGPSTGWGAQAINNTRPEWEAYLTAIKTAGARFVFKYTIETTGESTGGWFNLFQSSTDPGGTAHIGFANYSGDASMLTDELDGKPMSNQWSLLNDGSHVVTLDCAKYVSFVNSHTCNDHHPDGGVTIDDTTALCFQSGLDDGRSINVTDLYIEYPVIKDEEDPDPDPEPDIDATEFEMGLWAGQLNGTGPQGRVTVKGNTPAKYTVIVDNPIGDYENNFGMIIMKAMGTDNTSPLKNVTIRTTEVKVGDTVLKFKSGDYYDYKVGSDGKVNIEYVLFGGQIVEAPAAGAAPVSVTFIVDPDNYSEDLTLSAKTADENGNSVGDISVSLAKATYVSGDEVTLTAPDVLGYTFEGWYDGDKQVSTSLTYTFKITKDTVLVAKYKTTDTNATVTINTENGAEFTVSGGTLSGNKVTAKIGETITVTAKDSTKVLHWKNGSKKVLGTGASLDVIVTGDMTVTLVYKSETTGSSYVQFVSDYGQVLGAKLYKTGETVTLPDFNPAKYGYNFSGWVFDGTTTEATADAIKDKIGTETLITVKPTYTKKSTADATITVKCDADGTETKTTAGIGDWLTLEAPTVSGYTFKCWMIGDKVVGYNSSYFMQVTGNLTLTACYVAEAEEVDAKPVITIDAPTSVTDGDTHLVSCAVTRNVPAGYEVVEQGILFVKGGAQPSVAEFVCGSDKVTRHIFRSTDPIGVARLNVVVDGGETVYFRGYMILKNSAGNLEYYYTDIVSGSYNA